ncbi:MAG: prenyltransferase [Kiritimatiellae bacterium]|jgi:1,4-dihydroxy-2-naphthoate octaprenyltransferase|nr:prenyltransferase [Kiritimatiellia bacterium]MDD4340676.1 prenyltransferase [Kiritimatiellia bacterium]
MNAVRLWIKAVRPYAYSASLIPVAIGGVYARATGQAFSPARLGGALVAGLLIHTAANLWNDYFDFKSGVDRLGGGEGSGVLVRGELSPRHVFHAASLCAVLSLLAGLWLAYETSGRVLILYAIGLVGAVFYCAGSRSPKHNALGEIWVFLLMGVGMTLGGYMTQTGRFSWGAVAAGAPAGLLMTLLLYTNNMRDVVSDRAAGLRTLPMLFRPVEAKVVAGLMLVAAYAMTTGMVATRHLPVAVHLSLLTLPWAVGWFWQVWKGPVQERQVVGIASLHLVFGGMVVVGLWLGFR